ncbi:MAG: hypothetical protein CM15mP32_3840 [Flavobacteriaceae bacterium]|nr:MAG: hypothetical protein CM15mP32_3840 [Flavobacteriaceae bacterium]
MQLAAFLAKDFVFDVLLFGPKNRFPNLSATCQASNILGFDDGFCIGELPFRIQSRTMAGQFSAHIWTSITLGFVVSFPYVIYQFWKFISPVFTPMKEKQQVDLFRYPLYCSS